MKKQFKATAMKNGKLVNVTADHSKVTKVPVEDTVKHSWSNLKVMSSGKVISYTTHVANIVGNDLIIFGKFSRTTSKQMTKIAQYYGLNKVENF